MDFCLIFVPFGHYDEPEILRYPITSICPISADGEHVALEHTQRNARIICELAGRTDVPVHAGCARPLVGVPLTAPEVHGTGGLEGIEVDQPEMPLQPRHAVDFIVDTLRVAENETITLVALGPLTNLAVAMIQYPEILPKIREVVQLGSARREGGNVTPTANFNMIADPHAAHVVYGCGRPITAIGLDVTNRVRSTPERLATIEAIGTPVARAVHDVIVQFDRRRRMKYRDPAYPLGLAGPCAVAYLLRPALFQGRHMNVAIDLDSELTMGMTVVDCAGVTDRPANVLWMDQVDDGGVYALLIDGLKRL